MRQDGKDHAEATFDVMYNGPQVKPAARDTPRSPMKEKRGRFSVWLWIAQQSHLPLLQVAGHS